MSSNKQQSTSTTSLSDSLVLTKREIELAKRQAIKELSSLPLFVKNGERLHSNLSADDINRFSNFISNFSLFNTK